MKTKPYILLKVSLIFLLTFAVSCLNEPEQKLMPEIETPTVTQSCNDNSDFPNLGPSASQSQSCNDVTNPNNIGTLDCRTDNTVGGYKNLENGWGSYKITGGLIRYDGTRTRVERFFKTISQGTSKKTILSGKIRIVDLSDGNTCIVQSHAGGKIIRGVEEGSTSRSAQFLLYAMKNSSNKITLETHITNNPYTTDTGASGNGGRDIQTFKTLNYNQEYDFIYETGYNASGIAFSKIKIGETEKLITHNHTTERVYSRYGAYGTGDSGDVTAHIEFKDISLCRN